MCDSHVFRLANTSTIFIINIYSLPLYENIYSLLLYEVTLLCVSCVAFFFPTPLSVQGCIKFICPSAHFVFLCLTYIPQFLMKFGTLTSFRPRTNDVENGSDRTTFLNTLHIKAYFETLLSE